MIGLVYASPSSVEDAQPDWSQERASTHKRTPTYVDRCLMLAVRQRKKSGLQDQIHIRKRVATVCSLFAELAFSYSSLPTQTVLSQVFDRNKTYARCGRQIILLLFPLFPPRRHTSVRYQFLKGQLALGSTQSRDHVPSESCQKINFIYSRNRPHSPKIEFHHPFLSPRNKWKRRTN